MPHQIAQQSHHQERRHKGREHDDRADGGDEGVHGIIDVGGQTAPRLGLRRQGLDAAFSDADGQCGK